MSTAILPGLNHIRLERKIGFKTDNEIPHLSLFSSIVKGYTEPFINVLHGIIITT